MNRRNLFKGLAGVVTALIVPFNDDAIRFHDVPIVWDKSEVLYGGARGGGKSAMFYGQSIIDLLEIKNGEALKQIRMDLDQDLYSL